MLMIYQLFPEYKIIQGEKEIYSPNQGNEPITIYVSLKYYMHATLNQYTRFSKDYMITLLSKSNLACMMFCELT